MAATTFQMLLQPLEMATILTLAFTSGLSFCLSTWVIPNALLAPPKTMTRQFLATIARGERYLQPSSRILGLCLLSVTYLTAQNPNPAVASRWRYWAACLAILVPVAPYEIFVIFPINDQVKEIDAQIGKVGCSDPSQYALV